MPNFAELSGRNPGGGLKPGGREPITENIEIFAIDEVVQERQR